LGLAWKKFRYFLFLSAGTPSTGPAVVLSEAAANGVGAGINNPGAVV